MRYSKHPYRICRRWQVIASAAIFSVVATAAFGGAEPRPSVTVLTLEPRPMTAGLSFTGRVVAVEKVDVRARVSGFIK
jgi:membrane fusion protein, multidrug efflux system